MTANKPMTGEQLDELMTVAVNMQRDAETDCNRPSAMFAYAVQVAVLELRKARNDVAALAAENAWLKAANAEGCKWDGEQWVGISIETQATDAFLAEVRAQGVEMAAQSEQFSTWVQQGLRSFAIGVRQGDECAAQLRKGVQQ
ncbi:hypothetical protein [Enterobacter roggenkampii]|uniref:hypothetical protein n=1 Tax=Enterobacter roggenkampii TaxID=1812935 RepID=UPI001C6FD555|nr:hypothetical protein [Enterobacter roggenkampii]